MDRPLTDGVRLGSQPLPQLVSLEPHLSRCLVHHLADIILFCHGLQLLAQGRQLLGQRSRSSGQRRTIQSALGAQDRLERGRDFCHLFQAIYRPQTFQRLFPVRFLTCVPQ